MASDKKKVLITGGGTGGHIFPGLAIAKALHDRGCDITWLGAAYGMEKDLVSAEDIPIYLLSVKGFRGKSLLKKLMTPIHTLISIWKAYRIINKIKPDVVVAVGGFACFPGGIVARLKRIPLILHEQNTIPGTTNKILAKFANRICVGFPQAFKSISTREVVGNPVRDVIAALPNTQKNHSPKHLLILGGSLGAHAINVLLPEVMAQFPESERPAIWHQAGKSDVGAVKDLYQAHNVHAHVEPFIDNMAEAYAWADLAVARAGALTVSELACARLPSILIPFPFAIDDHQTHNARFLEDAKAAVCLRQVDISVESMFDTINRLFLEPEKLKKMAEAADSVAIRDTAARVSDIILTSVGRIA